MLGTDRFEEVIDGVDLEGLDGMAVEGGDEHDTGRLGKVPQQAREVEAVETGKVDVEEHGPRRWRTGWPPRLSL
jgi:hypothetical protein